MSITVASIITNLDSYLGDASTDRVSAAERLQYVTEATVWLQESLQNDHQIKTYTLDYVDSVNYYRVTTPLADLLEGADLRRKRGENYTSMAHKSSRELAEEVSGGVVGDDSWAIERTNGQIFLVVNAAPKYTALMLDDFEDATNIANWEADATTSDAENVAQDLNLFNEGSSSLKFDADVSNSVNNRATLTNDDLSFDLSSYESVGIFLLDVYLPTVDTISSFTLYWGNSSTSYWSVSVTTDLDGTAFTTGWNTLAFEWASATATSSPDADDDIDYFRIDMNYGAGQVDETDYRYDNFRLAISEPLTFHYVSWDVGTDSTGTTDRLAFTATTDIPFFSGQYDQYKFAVAHMAASLAFDNLRLKGDAQKEEERAYAALARVRKIFPTSVTKESKSFKAFGVNFNRDRFN